jgi:hypothetical protein
VKSKIDTAWFNDQIKNSVFGSQRQLARKMKGSSGKSLEPSALSLMLRGKQAMRDEDRQQLADLLSVPLVEILRRSGYELDDPHMKAVPVKGVMDRTWTYVPLKKEGEPILAPSDIPVGSFGIRVVTQRSEISLIDGWQFVASKVEDCRAEHVGRLCLVKPKSHKPTILFVERGYKAKTFNLVSTAPNIEPIESAIVEWCAPIIWIRPQA